MKNLFCLTAALLLFCGAASAQVVAAQVTEGDTVVDNADGRNTDGSMQSYRRSSLYSVLIKHSSFPYGETIDSTFMSIPTPDKFNNHDVGPKSFESSASKMKKKGKDKARVNEMDIEAFIEANDIARQMVARWFDRDAATGGFDMKLIQERGFESANWNDIELALSTEAGTSQLGDLGEELIGKTFLLVNDITFVDRGENSKKAGGFLRLFGSIVSAATGVSAAEDIGNLAGAAVNEIDGFKVNITSYLYRLDWNEAIGNTFYRDHFYFAGQTDEAKRAAFDASDIFKLTYIGQTTTSAANLASKNLSSKPKTAQMLKVCTRAIDKSIVELQRAYDEFKVNVPISRVNKDGTCEVPIGLKEGINEKSQFDVLIAEKDAETGMISYKKVGKIQPIKGRIWDNRFGALEDQEAIANEGAKKSDEDGDGDAALTATTFRILDGANRIGEGYLVRESTIKRAK